MAVLDKFQTKKSYAREVSPRMYKDPGTNYLDYDKIPEGTTFTAPSLAPKEYLLDQNAILPADRNPIDWQMVSETGGADISTEERNQRAYVRDYLAQKYAQVADTKGVEDALAKQKYENQWADAGHNVDRMLMAHSAARGGPGADAAYWQGQKKAAAGAVDEQEGLRQAKIKDYLMKQKMGSEGVDELQQMHGYDITNAQNDPTSDISRSYQNAFNSMFPNEAKDMGGDIPNMSATEIAGIAKMYGAKAEAELRRNVEMAKLGYADAGLQMQGRKIDAEEARAGRETTELAPKTKAEIDNIKAQIALTQARTKAVQAGKPGTSKTGSAVVDSQDFDSDKRFIASAIKEKKALDEYERATKDAIDSFAEGGKYNLWEGYAPAIEMSGKNITGGKRSEYNAFLAKVATQVIDKVPGIRSDSDFQNLVRPMLPAPGDPQEIVAKKLQIFKNFLKAKRPEATTYDMLSEKDKMKIGGKQSANSSYRGDIVIQDGIEYHWNGQGYQEAKGVK